MRRLKRMGVAGWLATWGGSGLLPYAPGTWGSLAALPFGWLLLLTGSWPLLLAAALLIVPVGVWSAQLHAQSVGIRDPGEIVIDEVCGQWLTLVPAGLDPVLFPLAFVVFRLLDIIKLWPASTLDRRTHGGVGIMADDFAAGVQGAIIIYLLALLLGRDGCFPTIC